jgi:hypothetical protein
VPLINLLEHDEERVLLAQTQGTPTERKPRLAAAEPALTADFSYIAAGYALIAFGWLVAWLLWKWRDPAGFMPPADVTVFAPLYIFAQAIERVLEPFSKYLGAASPPAGNGPAKVKKDAAMFNVLNAIASGDAETAAKWKTVVDPIRRNTAVITWAGATVLGTLASGVFGIFLLRAVGFAGMPEEVDMIITGLAIGSGTKPLHDLISNLQKAKENREDPPEAGGSA